MITIYHNPRCRKSREALTLLNDSGQHYQVREYLKEPPSKQEISELLQKLNLHPLEVIRQGESVFKENYKGKDLTVDQWIQIMADNPILIERPLVVKDKYAVIARPPAKINELLKG